MIIKYLTQFSQISMINDIDLEEELRIIILKLDERYTYISHLLQARTWQDFQHHLINIPNLGESLRSRQSFIQFTTTENIAFLINHKFIKLIPERINLSALIPILHLLKKDVYFTPDYQWLHQRFQDIIQFYRFLNSEDQLCEIDDKNKKLRKDILNSSIEALYSKTPNKESYAYKFLSVMAEDQKNIFQIIAVNTLYKFAPHGQDQSKKDIIFDKFLSSSIPSVLLQLLSLESNRMEQVRESICELKLVLKDEKWELQGECKVERACLTSEILLKSLTTSGFMYRHLANNFFVSTEKQVIFKYEINQILQETNFRKEQFFNTRTKIKRETDYSLVKSNFQSIITSAFTIIEGISLGKTMWAFSNSQLVEVSHEKALLLALKLITYLFRTRFTFEFDLQNGWEDKPTIKFEVSQDQLREAFSRIIQYLLGSQQVVSRVIINGVCEVIRWFEESDGHSSVIQSVFSKEGEKEISTSFFSLMVKYMNQPNSESRLPYNVGIWMLKNVKKELVGEKTPISLTFYFAIYAFLVENHRYHNIISLELDQMNSQRYHKLQFYKLVEQFLDKNPDFAICVIDRWMDELKYLETDGNYFRKDRKYRLAILIILFNHQSFPINEEIKPRVKNLLGIQDIEHLQFKEEYKYIWQAFLKKIDFDIPSEFDFALSQALLHTQDLQILASNYKIMSYRLIKAECLRQIIKAITRLHFMLIVSKPEPTEAQVMQLVDIMFNLIEMQCNYQQKLEQASQEYSQADLQWLKTLSQNGFQTFYKEFLTKFQSIMEFLASNVDNITIINSMLIRLGTRINYLIEKADNTRLIHKTLGSIAWLIRKKSQKIQCEFFLQFYNHYKQPIINLLQAVFDKHSLKFQSEDEPNRQQNQIQFALMMLKEGKKVQEEWENLNKLILEYSIKKFVGELFSNENWQYTVLLNNIKYEKTNNLKFFEKTMQEDLASRIISTFHPKNLIFYQKLFKMIDDCYHRRSRDDLECPQTTLTFDPPAEPLVLITKISELDRFYRTYELFILKLFENWQALESSDSFHKLYNTLLSELEDESKTKLQKQILNQLIKNLFGILTESSLTWSRYQKIHLYINTVVDSFNDPIGSLLSQQFVEAYFARLSESLPKGCFTAENTKPFLQFVERLVPDSKPEPADGQFEEYTRHSIQTCIKLVKLVKVAEVEDTIISLIAKIIRMRESYFDHSLIELFRSVEGVEDTFSQLFCELVEKQLREASIEQQIKSYFFRLQQQNKGKDQQNRVKLSLFAELFSGKYKPHKKQLIQVAYKLTHKLTIKEESRSTKYLIYNQDQPFSHSIFLGKDFIESRPTQHIRTILSSFIKGIQAADDKKLGKQLKELRVLSFSYPILTAYILMHPKQQGESTVPFIDYLLDIFCSQDVNEDHFGFFAYLSLDVGLIFTHNHKSIFFSEYLCHRMVSRLMDGELTNRKLLLIYFLAKIKRFAGQCFKKLRDGKSMCDLLWERLSSFRQDQVYSNHLNVLVYAILVLLYRENNVEGLFQYCEYKRDDDWEGYNSIFNANWLPFKNMRMKNSTKEDETFKVSKDYEQQNKEVYEYFQSRYPQWYDAVGEQKQQQIKEHEPSTIAEVKMSSESLKHLGSLAKTHGSEYRDIEGQVSTSYFQSHRSAFEVFRIFFLDHGNDNSMLRKRRRNKDSEFVFFEKLQADSDHQPSESSEDEERQEEFNTNRQSTFAPEEFVRVRQPEQREDAKSQDFENELQARLNELSGESPLQDQVIEEQVEEFTAEMTDLFNTINDRLAHLQRPLLTLAEVQGNNLQAKLQFLQGKELQTDFDVKEATMTMEEFESYCLGNVSKLERLSSERRNVVRSMEDLMLMRFVQRSISSDSVDYIIDTIDENYQLLPNLLPHKLSVNGEDPQLNKPKTETNIKYIKGACIPLQNFEDIADQRLYELLLTLYFTCGLLPSKNLVPFFENKRIQSKLVNTLLYIYRNPFDNPHFPNKSQSFDLQNLKWVEEANKQTATNEIRTRIADVFMTGKTTAFYQDSSYLSEEIDFKGIKDIMYEPANKLLEGIVEYRPINEVLELILTAETKKAAEQEEQQHDSGYVFSLFNGMTQLLEPQFEKFMDFLKEVHKSIVKKVSNESQNIDYDDISKITSQEKSYNIQVNLKALLESQKIRESIKASFPLDSQDTDPFFVLLFMNSNVYSRQQLLKFHGRIIEKDVPNSSNVYFSNMGFKLYSEEELRECSWVKKSQNILPCIVKSLPKHNLKLNEQPFYRLCAYPDFMVLTCKSQILYRKVQEHRADFSFSGSEEVVAQRKKGIFQSAFLDLRNKPDGFWYQNFSVKFMNEAGKLQSGYGRGVAKDWYAYVTKGMANLNYGIFMRTGKNYYFFNRQSWINPRHLQFLEFIGKLFALAIINREFYLAPSFSILIYKMILGERIDIMDIAKEFDEGEVIRNIEKLREYHDDSLFCESFVYEDKRLISNRNLEILRRKRSVEAVETKMKEGALYLLQEAVELKEEAEETATQQVELSLEEEQAPKMIKVLKIGESLQLLPNGAEIAVNKDNLEQFIALTKQKIYDIIVNGVQQQFNAFMAGFRRVVKPDFIRNITAEELREIAEGCDKISVEDLKKYVTVGRGLDGKLMEWFWECLEGLSARDRMYLIQHWTGLPKISAEGFKGTNLNIVRGQYEGRLFAQTCFNKLHLPEFPSKEKLEEAVRMAINSVKVGESIIED